MYVQESSSESESNSNALPLFHHFGQFWAIWPLLVPTWMVVKSRRSPLLDSKTTILSIDPMGLEQGFPSVIEWMEFVEFANSAMQKNSVQYAVFAQSNGIF